MSFFSSGAAATTGLQSPIPSISPRSLNHSDYYRAPPAAPPMDQSQQPSNSATAIGSRSAVLSTLRGLQAEIKIREQQRDDAQAEAGELAREISRRTNDFDHARQVENLTSQEQEAAQRQQYEAALSERNEVQRRLEQLEGQRQTLKIKVSDAKREATEAEILRQESEGKLAALEARVANVTADVQACRDKLSQVRLAKADASQTYAEQIAALHQRRESLSEAYAKERDRRLAVESKVHELQGSKVRSAQYMKGILAANETLMDAAAGSSPKKGHPGGGKFNNSQSVPLKRRAPQYQPEPSQTARPTIPTGGSIPHTFDNNLQSDIYTNNESNQNQNTQKTSRWEPGSTGNNLQTRHYGGVAMGSEGWGYESEEVPAHKGDDAYSRMNGTTHEEPQHMWNNATDHLRLSGGSHLPSTQYTFAHSPPRHSHSPPRQGGSNVAPGGGPGGGLGFLGLNENLVVALRDHLVTVQNMIEDERDDLRKQHTELLVRGSSGDIRDGDVEAIAKLTRGMQEKKAALDHLDAALTLVKQLPVQKRIASPQADMRRQAAMSLLRNRKACG